MKVATSGFSSFIFETHAGHCQELRKQDILAIATNRHRVSRCIDKTNRSAGLIFQNGEKRNYFAFLLLGMIKLLNRFGLKGSLPGNKTFPLARSTKAEDARAGARIIFSCFYQAFPYCGARQFLYPPRMVGICRRLIRIRPKQLPERVVLPPAEIGELLP